MILNKQRFEDAYKQLRDKAYKNGDKEPSFMTGFWYAQEGYKYGIWEVKNWNTTEDILFTVHL